jgi:hypothetical protein
VVESEACVPAAYRMLKLFYFDWNEDPDREMPFLARLGR